VIFITNTDVITLPEYLKHIRVVDIIQHETTPSALQFKKVYNPLSASQPYELRNTLRFFVLHSFMDAENLPYAVYMDSDAQLTQHITLDELDGNDVMLVEDERSDNTFNSFKWVFWAGTSILSKNILEEFMPFVISLFQPPFFEKLVLVKEKRVPFFCDMSSWYLFGIASSSELAIRWSKPEDIFLPKTKNFKYKLGWKSGFDINSIDQEPTFKFDHKTGTAMAKGSKIKSIHFQQSKNPPKIKENFHNKPSLEEIRKKHPLVEDWNG